MLFSRLVLGVFFGVVSSVSANEGPRVIEGRYAEILFGTLYCEGDAPAEFSVDGFIETRCGYTDQFSSNFVEAHFTEGVSVSLDVPASEYFAGVGAVVKEFDRVGSKALRVEHEADASGQPLRVSYSSELAFIACEREGAAYRCELESLK
jgi:hypothetical protein